MSDKPKLHKHCWHYLTGYSNGLGSEGRDSFQCCHCGRKRERLWKSAPNPAHGPYAQELVKCYDDEVFHD